MAKKNNAHDQILDAAEVVVARSGAAHLTLESVANEAGVSKGGLLYHFPTKEALLQGMLHRVLARVEDDQQRFAAEQTGTQAAGLIGLVRAGFLKRPEQRQIAAALLAAGANNPDLLQPVRAWHARNVQNMALSRGNPSRANVVMLALDGLWLSELLQTSPLTDEERRRLQIELEQLATSAD